MAAAEQGTLAIHDQVLVETEIAGKQVALTAFVTNVLPETLWLALRVAEPRLARLLPGQPVHLSFDRPGGAVVAESHYVRCLGGERMENVRTRVFAVERPAGVENVQRRAHVRVDLERTVYLQSLAFAGGAGQSGTGRTLNISAGGLQILTTMPLAFGDTLKVALVLGPADIVTAAAQVVRIEDPDSASLPAGAWADARECLSKVAIRFNRIPEVDRERIACHVLSAQRRLEAAAPRRAPAQAQGAGPQIGEPVQATGATR